MNPFRARRPAAATAPPSPLSFSERYRVAEPEPAWRRAVDPGRLADAAQALVAVALLVAVGYLGWLAVTWSARLSAPPRTGAATAPAGTTEVRLRTSDGVALRGWYAPASTESDAAVVLVHEWGESAAELTAAHAYLRDRFAVLSVELRGHGRDGAASTLGAGERQDVAAAVEAAREAGATRVGVLGVGMGAVAAVGAAGADPEIAAVVADSPYLSVADWVAEEVDREDLPVSRPGNWAVLLGMLFRTGADVTAADARPALETTSVPTLLVAGARDGLLPEDALDALARATSPLTVWTIPGAGHTDTRARAGAAYPERVLSFFSEHLASR